MLRIATCSTFIFLFFIVPSFANAQTQSVWIGKTGFWSDPANWSSGTVPDNGGSTFDVFIDGNDTGTDSILTLNIDATIDRLTVDSNDRLFVDNGNELTIVNGIIANSGQIDIGGINGVTALRLGNNTTITGAGKITMASNFRSVISGVTSGDLITIGLSQTIEGQGKIGLGTTSLVNNGSIEANSNAAILEIDPLTSSSMINNGTIQANGGGVLLFRGGTYDNSDGVIQAKNGSIVDLGNGTTFDGGSFVSSGTGHLRVLHGTTTLEGNISNNSTISVEGINSVSRINLADGTVLNGTGMINLVHDFNSGISGVNTSGDAYTIGTNQTVQGIGLFGRANDEITLNGKLIAANGSNLGDDLIVQAFTLANNNEMVSQADQKLHILRGIIDNTNGVIRAENGGLVVLGAPNNPLPRIFGGTLQSNGSGKLLVENGGFVEFDGSINNLANIEIGGINATTQIDFESSNATSSITGTGKIELTSQDRSTIVGSFINGSNHLIHGQGRILATVTNQGTIRADAGGNLLLSAGMTNEGLVEASNGTLEKNGSYVQTSGLTLVNGGSIVGSATLNVQGGGVEGNGSISNSISLDGYITPGFSPGQLPFNNDAGELVTGDLTMLANAETMIEIGGLDQGTEFDFIDVDGNAVLGGDLRLQFIDGFQNGIDFGDTFTILNGTSLGGAFTNVANGETLATEDGFGSFRVNYGFGSAFNSNSVVLSNFASVPEPSTFGLLGLLAAGTLIRKRRNRA